MSWRDSKDLTVWKNEGPAWTAMHQCHGDDLCAYLTAREHQTEIHCLSMVRWNKFALRFCQNLFFLAPLISNLNGRLVGCRTESWGQTTTPSRDNLPSLWSVASRMPSNTWRSGVADGGDKEEIMRFLETAINQKQNKSWWFQVFPVPIFFLGKMGSRLMSIFSNWRIMEWH